jgi:phosphoribosylanthranilate isomerase
MKPTLRPRIKICCISSVEEAQMAVEYGASAIGLVSAMPSGPGVISEETIAAVAAMIPPGVSSFLLTSRKDAPSIVSQQNHCRTNTIQLVDSVPIHVYAELRRAMPGIALVQVIHVNGEESVNDAKTMAGHVDALLLDSGNPALAVRELGGTGRTHDWEISRKIREAVDVPLFLAGGLHAGNVAQAIAAVSPFGVDLCSGVRTNGKLDRAKLRAFMDAVRASESETS